jgi:hypothetical protein
MRVGDPHQRHTPLSTEEHNRRLNRVVKPENLVKYRMNRKQKSSGVLTHHTGSHPIGVWVIMHCPDRKWLIMLPYKTQRQIIFRAKQ